MSKEQEIKIKINKESARIFETPGISERPEESVAPAFVAGKTQKKRKFFNPGKLAAFFLRPCFSDADFRRSSSRRPARFRQNHSFFGGILLTAFFWILSAIQRGSVKIPKSALLISCGAIVLIWLASALSSGNAGLSLAGKLYDLDTFSVIFAASLALFFGSMIFQSEKRAFVFYLTLFCSSFVVFLFQLLRLVFGINIIPFNIFPSNTSNLIGGWNDFSIFSVSSACSLWCFWRQAKFGKIVSFFLYIILLMSFWRWCRPISSITGLFSEFFPC